MRKAGQNAVSSRRVLMDMPEDFEHLLILARQGDEDAFASIWRTFQPGLIRYLRVIGGQAADDLAADTWLQVTRKLSTFEGNDKAFRAWLYTIARHRHIDWRRQATRRRESLVEVGVLDRLPSSDDTTEKFETTISTQEAVALIATLPPDQAEAVMLRTVSGLPVSVVAEIMGRPPGTVRVLCHRGLRRLASSLEGAVPDKASETAEVVV
ncbi:MAG TPA: RNA polymerase sigma factor [Acidimicrobiales bacterium]|nr:RNA polymerase sigma factor [Acidimicrobiales bacterium]